MKSIRALLVVASLIGPTAGAQTPPPWAFAVNPPGAKALQDDGTFRHVPESGAAFTLTQIRDLFGVPDWHPDRHPQMPEPVAHGAKPGVFACGYCHLANGLGRPENASLAGLPAEYIVRQVEDFRSGARKSSGPGSVPVKFMIATAKAVGDVDLKSAAEYFSALRPKPWIRIVEADTVPRTQVAGWMLVASPGADTESIGQRIIEMPENQELTELRDDASGFFAYVPTGSVRMGEALVKTGGSGKTTPCAICHGDDLKGLGPVPALAGRSPSYVVRQLYDMQRGVRRGPWAELMKPVVAKLTTEDMVAIAAYTASRAP